MSDSESHAGLAVFRHTNFTLYQIERFCIVAGLEAQSVAVGWQVYEITRRPLDLGLFICRTRSRPLQPKEPASDLQPGICRLLSGFN
jgi:hypothetical protein